MKASKKLLVVLVATIISMGTAYANPQNTLEKQVEKEFNQMDSKQKEVLRKAMVHPKLGPTLGAITWIESAAGEQQVNVNSNNNSMSCGDYGINTASYLIKKGQKVTSKSKKEMCKKLIKDPKLARDAAINELNLWAVKYKKKPDSKIVLGSYNGGNKPNMNYANKVQARANFLQKKFKISKV